jgi:hypothetical protein
MERVVTYNLVERNEVVRNMKRKEITILWHSVLTTLKHDARHITSTRTTACFSTTFPFDTPGEGVW